MTGDGNSLSIRGNIGYVSDEISKHHPDERKNIANGRIASNSNMIRVKNSNPGTPTLRVSAYLKSLWYDRCR